MTPARFRSFILATLVAGMWVFPALSTATEPPFDRDGWFTWRVAAAEGAGDWCCYRWNAGKSSRGQCDLDSRHGSWGHFDGDDAPAPPPTGELQIYGRFQAGDLTELRTLSPSCPVRADTTWTDLGRVEAEQSLDWLGMGPGNAGSRAGEQLQADRLMALAAHAGDASRKALVQTARTAGDRKQREQAIFWMGQLRVEETRDELLELMRDDDSRAIREKAIFSYAQSPAEDRTEVLIAVIEDGHRDLHDRKQALFWLAQSDDTEGVDYIQSLLLDP